MFEAWTDPALLSRWLIQKGGSATTSLDLRVGGKYKHDMIKVQGQSACTSDTAPGEPLPHEGEYLEVVPPEKLVFTWNTPSVKNTRVTVELRDLGDSTELWLTHELLPTEEDRSSHTAGWNACLSQLEELLG